MCKHLFRNFTAVLALCMVAALAVCALPGSALAAEAEVPSAAYATLSAAVGAGERNIKVVGAADACNIPSGVTVTIDAAGSLAGDFCNRGIVYGAGRCTGTISNFGGTVSGGGNVVNFTEVASGASILYDAGLHPIAVTVYDGKSWIVSGQSPYYYVGPDGYLRYYSSGDKVTCSITYLYSNAGRTTMRLDNKTAYPSSYAVSFTKDVVIPAAPDKEIDYKFIGWACDELGYVEGVNPQSALTIPAGTFGNLTLVSCWSYQNGYNENLADGSTAMSTGGGAASGGAGGGTASGGATAAMGGMSGGISGLLGASDDEDEDDTDSESNTVVNLLAGSQSGGMRVRNASSTTRHSFANTNTDDIEARANARKQKSFPWQWVGVGLGGALILFAVGMTIRRKRNERNAATLEKLRIYD